MKDFDSKVPKNVEEEDKDNESDYLDATIGPIGIWQVCVCVAASSTRYIAKGNLTIITFLTPATEFICTEFGNNITIAVEKMTCYESCAKYEYNSSAMDQTIISDFELICDREWLASFAQTILMFGVMIGVSLFGWISDSVLREMIHTVLINTSAMEWPVIPDVATLFGRRVALIVSVILNLCSMIPSAFAPNYWVYISLRLVIGIATGGSLIICFPISMEVWSSTYRAMAASLVVLPDSISDTSLALLAYFLPTWKLLTLGFSIVCMFILVLVFVVPESPRWLISKGKVDDAIRVITRAAKWNKLGTDHIRDTVIKNYETLGINHNDHTSASYLDLFKNKSLRKITFTTFIIWTLIGSMFFGLYQYMTLLAANVYSTVIIIGLVQVPLCFIQILIIKYFGRKSTMISLLTASGIALLILMFTPKGHWSGSVLGLIGFSTCCTGFGIAYIYHGELYPTPLRSMALGLASAANKSGAMASPFIARISPVWIPSLIFATMAFVAAAFCILLPETKGKNLRDTVN